MALKKPKKRPTPKTKTPKTAGKRATTTKKLLKKK